MTEIDELRAELAKVTAERDAAMAAKKAKHKEMFEATNYYEDLIREIEAERDAAREERDKAKHELASDEHFKRAAEFATELLAAREALAVAVEAEREACAQVIENWHVLRNGDMTSAKLATAIRARKEPTP